MYYAIFLTIALIFILIGVALILIYARNRRIIKSAEDGNGDIEKVTAKLIEHETSVSRNSGTGRGRGGYTTYYHPVYEYVFNGTRSVHTSSSGCTSPKPIGSETTLYIDKVNIKVIEVSENKVNLIIGIAFVVLSSLFLFMFANAVVHTQP